MEPYSIWTRSSHLSAWTQLVSDRICYVFGLQLWLLQTIISFCLLGRISPRLYWSQGCSFWCPGLHWDCRWISDRRSIVESLTSGPSIVQIYLTLYHGALWSNKFQCCPEVALIWSCFLFVAICLSLVRWCNLVNSLAILPIALESHVIELDLAGFWRVSHNGPNCAIFGTSFMYSITWHDMALFHNVASSLILMSWCNHEHSLAILPIASGLPKIQNPVAIVWIANIEVLIAGGLRQPERALFGDCGAPRGLQRIPEHASGPALQSGLRPDGQPLG